jgi:FlaA1/EpsC-like NDP-sugar epimerase
MGKREFLSRNRRVILMLLDILCVTAAYLVTWIAISGRANLVGYRSLIFSSTVLFVMCFVTVFVFMGMYDSLWRYAEIYEFFRCALAAVLAVAAFVVITSVIYADDKRIFSSVYLMSSLFAVSLTLYIRLTYRMFRNTKITYSGKQRHRVLVVGAGDAASTLLHEIFKDPGTDYNIVCAVDDNPQKVGRTIMGVKIMGSTDEIPNLVTQCDIDTILIAMPSVGETDKRRILNICSKTSCNMRMLPDITRLISDGKDLLSRVRDVKVEDLLGREEIDLDQPFNDYLKDKTVLVTGAGGSIGAELCVQIAASRPKRLIMVDIYENNTYDIEQKLRMEYGDSLNLEVCIASVRDSKKMDRLFYRMMPDIVFHAAAHKHVPLMETSPEEAVKNNVCGTLNVVQAAHKYGVDTFVLISTDKAVNPTSIMGATKRICEMIVQAMSKQSETRFVAVRFGNVLGSNGSVIPLFKEQITNGGPVTVTHPDIVRYFMTTSEAVSLVINACEIAHGGEIFVLDMGHQVKILDLAENLIRLAGFVPYKDIEIVFTGLRPGEKLYEELLLSEEGVSGTGQKKIFIGNAGDIDSDPFFAKLAELKESAYANDNERVVGMIKGMVPTFKHEAWQQVY